MAFKEATDCCAGSAAKYGAPDVKKIAELLNGKNPCETALIRDILFQIVDPCDTTKRTRLDVGGNTTCITGILATTFTTAKTLTFPNATDTLMGKATTDTNDAPLVVTVPHAPAGMD